MCIYVSTALVCMCVCVCVSVCPQPYITNYNFVKRGPIAKLYMEVAGYDVCIVEKYHGNRLKVLKKNLIVDNTGTTHCNNVKFMPKYS